MVVEVNANKLTLSNRSMPEDQRVANRPMHMKDSAWVDPECFLERLGIIEGQITGLPVIFYHAVIV